MRPTALVPTLCLAAALLAAAGAVRAQDIGGPDPAPSADDLQRGVARISLMNGDVSVRRGDSGDVVAAVVNAPLMSQDRVITNPSSRVEMQFDSANFMRLGSNAELVVAQLAYGSATLQLARGTATFRVLRDGGGTIEIDTPSVSLRPARSGVYRLTVRENGETEVTVRAGELEIASGRGTQHLGAGQTLLARGAAADAEFQVVAAIGYDDWDRWNEGRDQLLERSTAYRYVSRDINGAEDLDPYGQWVNDPSYGYVWQPTVGADWAPYQNGRWVWMDYYGWTWVSSDPWGWAPYHYGRWYYGGRGWCWYPGGIGSRHYWSPALVAFFGFGHRGGGGFGFGHVGWVPLGPHERYDRWWGRGGNRGGNFNVTNVNVTNVYRNARVHNGVTAVASGDFSRGRSNNFVRPSQGDLGQAALVRGQIPAGSGNSHLRFTDRQPSGATRVSSNTQFYSQRSGGQNQMQRVPSAVQASPRSDMQVQRNSGAGNSGGGWRRFGDNPGTSGQGAPAARSDMQVQRAPAQQAPSQPRNDGGNGWRRFGDPSGGSAPSAAPRSTPQPQPPQSAPRSDRGWGRFGDPATSRQQNPQSAPSSGYDRRGTQSAPSYSQPAAPRYAAPQQQSQPRSIQIAPPVVRERSSAPSSARSEPSRSGGNNGGGGGSGRVSRSDGGSRGRSR